ncbi:MAG: carboxypeptidase-like regulatory domain-containing protein [Acidobacteriota bacterium]
MRRAIFILLLAAACVPVWADSDLTKLEIKVVDDRGKPIERANVRVVFKQGRRKLTMKKIRRSWELKTSQEGYARIPGIPKGDILIQVTAKNHQSFGDTFTIEEDERLVNVELKPPQVPFSVHGPNDPRPAK